MRLIEQLVKVLAKILFNKQNGNYNEALNNIDNALSTFAGLDYFMLNRLSVKDIKTLLSINEEESSVSVKCIIAAKLLKERTDILKLNGCKNLELIQNYQKALDLYLGCIMNIKSEEMDLGGYYADIKELAEILKNEITPEERLGLAKFYGLLGEYTKAGNELSKLNGSDNTVNKG
jgi:tetratricopeptide (TPR) repeat protein